MPLRRIALAFAFTAAGLGATPPPPHPDLWTRLGAEITQIAEGVDGRVGVQLVDLASGATFSLRADQTFATASTIKLAILLALYQADPARLGEPYSLRVEDRCDGSPILGTLTPGTRVTLRDLALFMTATSDNTATNVLIDRLGMAAVNAALDRLGLGAVRLRRRMMDLEAARQGRENVGTPRQIASLLASLAEGPALTPAARADLLALLAAPKAGFLNRLLPEDLPVANKPGVLPGVRNDAGIVSIGGRRFVLVVMASHLRDERQGEEAIARIAFRAAACLDMATASPDHGRILGGLQVR